MTWKSTASVSIAQETPGGVSKRDLDIPLSDGVHTALGSLRAKGHTPLIVGGAVRDALRGESPKDIDIEVYGSNYDDLTDTLSEHGKVNVVGKAFGVVKFRDKQGGEYDFSIPRRDNKAGVGHKDFNVDFDSTLTPKDAAARRDFTWNALAYDPERKELHDYFGGEQDLKDGVIRHTSDAFAEDPLRVLRGMQFSARYGMTVHPDTAKLARSIKDQYSTLPKERVGEEFMKLATKGKEPGRAMDYLQETGWSENFPQLHVMRGTPQDTEWHPEGDLHEHTKHTMNAAAKIADREGLKGDDRATVVLGAMCHDIGKPSTTKEWPYGYRETKPPERETEWEENGGWRRPTVTSHGHDVAGGPIARQFLDDIGIKPDISDKVQPLVEQHMQHLNYEKNLSSRTVRRLADRLHPASIKELGMVMEADHSGRPPLPTGMPSGAQKMLDKASESQVTDHKAKRLVEGRDVMPYFNNEPGRHIGDHVKAAYEAQLDGEFDTREQGLDWLHKRLTGGPQPPKTAHDDYASGPDLSDEDQLEDPDFHHPKMYHATDRDNREAIQREGLRPGSYAWDTLEHAQGYAPWAVGVGKRYEQEKWHDQPYDIWEVNAKSYHQWPDEQWAEVEGRRNDNAHVIQEAVKPEHLRLVHTSEKTAAVDLKHLIVDHGADPRSIDHTNSAPEDIEWVHDRIHEAHVGDDNAAHHESWVSRLDDPAHADEFEDIIGACPVCKGDLYHHIPTGTAVCESGHVVGNKAEDSFVTKDFPEKEASNEIEVAWGPCPWCPDEEEGIEGLSCEECRDTKLQPVCAKCGAPVVNTMDGWNGWIHFNAMSKAMGGDIPNSRFKDCHPDDFRKNSSWEGFPFDERTGQEPNDKDTSPERTGDGHFVLYHGTSPEGAESILKERSFRPDDFGKVGFGTTPGAARIYGIMKSGPNAKVIRAVVDKDWLVGEKATREIGGSGYDQFLIGGPHRAWSGVPSKAIHDLQVMSQKESAVKDWSACVACGGSGKPQMGNPEQRDSDVVCVGCDGAGAVPFQTSGKNATHHQCSNCGLLHQLGTPEWQRPRAQCDCGRWWDDPRLAATTDPLDEAPDAGPRLSKTASWRDVRNKAVRLRNANMVRLVEIDENFVTANVQGDHDRYSVVLFRQFPGSQSITTWECECEWGQWAWKRKTYFGRLCSHALATLYTAQAKEFSKGGSKTSTAELCPVCNGDATCLWCHDTKDPDESCNLCNGSKMCTNCDGSGVKIGSKMAGLGRGKIVLYGRQRVEINVEVARDANSIQQGLMNRYFLGPREGMAFVYPYPPSYSGFWMMNTFIPLSIAFWDREGRIIDIHDMDPVAPGQRPPVYNCSKPYWGAVEVNQGFFAQWGIRPGDRVELHI